MGRRDANGAFDALVHAIVGLGAVPNRAELPPATAPPSLALALGTGLLQARGTRDEPAGPPAPLPAEGLTHEGQRSVVELAAILWHALDGPGEAPELAPQLAPPHTDPIIALSLPRRRLAEYAVPEGVDRSTAFPGSRVWLIEIERARGETPGAIAVWRSRSADGEWRTRCACIWTHGRIASTAHPLVIGAQWDDDGSNALAGACVLGAPWEHATHAATDAAKNGVITRRQNAIGNQMMARIAIPAALAWLDENRGVARPAGRFGAEKCAGHRPRLVHPVRAPARRAPPAWLGATPERAVEAVVLRTAGEGWRVGASCPVPEWRDGWAGYAELGAVAWAALDDLDRRIDSETWTAMERAVRNGTLVARSAHPGLEATSALVRKMLAQAGRSHVAHAPDARPLCALEIPARLWRALREAGPCPEPPPPAELTHRWWLVEIEHPAEDEPNAVALWHADGTEVVLSAFLGVEDGENPPCLTVVTWRTAPDGTRTRAGVAVLGSPVRVDDLDSPESQAGARQVIDTLAAADTGPIARVRDAIALHLANGDAPAALGPYRASTGDAGAPREGAPPQRGPFTALFALRRAPEPVWAERHPTGRRGHRDGGRGPLLERQEVGPHWKRQAHGPRHSKRRWQLIERYERGPAPEDDQIVVTRLAERQGGAQAAQSPPRRAERKTSRRQRHHHEQ